jgi:hypothetical protein
MIAGSNIAVVYENSSLDAHRNLNETINSCKISLPPQDIVTMASPSAVTEAERQMPLRTLLSRGEGTEKQAQQVISSPDCLKLLSAVNTSAATNSLYSLPRRVGQSDNVYPATARIDLLSQKCPMGMEVKATSVTSTAGGSLVVVDIEGLTQGLRRLWVMRSTNACINTFIMFVVTGRSAWLLLFTRTVESYRNGNFETITLTRIKHEDVWRTWLGYTKMTEDNAAWFLTCDAVHIMSTLNCIVSPSLCGTQLLQASNHRVYAVSLPKIFRHRDAGGRWKKIVGITSVDPDFCLKVIPKRETFNNEAKAALEVCVSYHARFSSSLFYVIGTHELPTLIAADQLQLGSISIEDSNRDDIVEDREEEDENEPDAEGVQQAPSDDSSTRDLELAMAPEKPIAAFLSAAKDASKFVERVKTERTPLRLKHLVCKNISGCAWNNDCPDAYGTGGTIVMRVGIPDTIAIKNMTEVLAGIYECLEAIHEAGWLHCDIRASNILRFGDRFQLVDLDCAQFVGLNSPTRTAELKLRGGGQYNSRPPRLSSHKIGDTIMWSRSFDCEMAALCVARAVSAASSVPV